MKKNQSQNCEQLKGAENLWRSKTLVNFQRKCNRGICSCTYFEKKKEVALTLRKARRCLPCGKATTELENPRNQRRTQQTLDPKPKNRNSGVPNPWNDIQGHKPQYPEKWSSTSLYNPQSKSRKNPVYFAVEIWYTFFTTSENKEAQASWTFDW